LTLQHALFLDFDGTLAPLQDNADTVHINEAQHETLLQLSHARDGALALLSGRDVRDLAARTPRGVTRIGNHGLYALAPDTDPDGALDPLPASLERALNAAVGRQDGAYLEVKGPVGTVHYRACPDAGPMLIDAVQTAVATHKNYKTKLGNHVAEAIPIGADKGSALERAMSSPPFAGRIPVMVGDDTTDEDAFLAAQRLGGFGVKVGRGETVARKQLANVSAVWAWLGASL
jgi:trehalose 6-phosphate phosphatase